MKITDIQKVIKRAIKEYENGGKDSLPYTICHEAVLQSKNAEYMYLFAKNVPGVYMPRFKKAIARTKDEKYIRLFDELLEKCAETEVENQM